MNEPMPQKKVLEAAALVLLRWGGGRGWDVSAIWKLRAAFNRLPEDEKARLMASAEAEVNAEEVARAERVAAFDAWVAEKRAEEHTFVVVNEELAEYRCKCGCMWNEESNSCAVFGYSEATG